MKRRGELRGCIGYTEGRTILWEDVRSLAVVAASRDTRFSPVAADELPELLASVTVLTPPRPITADAVVVGRDGLMIEHGDRRGLFLPQVPVEFGWGREVYLARLCQKAGLPGDAWQHEDTVLEAFEGQVFCGE